MDNCIAVIEVAQVPIWLLTIFVGAFVGAVATLPKLLIEIKIEIAELKAKMSILWKENIEHDK